MKNEEKRDQMIRETFDQCLSGIDLQPSALPEIERKIEKTKTPERKRIPLRIPVIAAAAVVLVCVWFFAGNKKWELFSQPDRLSTDSRYTVQPMETVLSEGAERETAEETPGTEVKLNGIQTIRKEDGTLQCRMDGLVYTLRDDKTAVLSGVYFVSRKDPYILDIPEKVGEYTVVALADDALSSVNAFAAVHLPETLTTIGFYGFAYNPVLTEVTFPSSLRTIEWNAFMECTSLASVTFEEGVETIQSGVFNGCKSLKSIVIPDSVTTLEGGAFSACTGLEEIVLPKGITELGQEMFNSCSSLKQIEIPKGVTVVGNRAFKDCSALESVVLPEELVSLGNGAFNGCKSLKSVVIPEKVTAIENGTFNGCTSLKTVVLPEGLTSIGSRAFYNCGSLSILSLPDSLASIGRDAFGGCDELLCVVSDGSAAMQYCEENGIKYTKR